MRWTVLFKDPKRIEKAVDKLRPSTQVAFKRAIRDLGEQGPAPQGWFVKKLVGDVGEYRMSMRLDYRHRMIYDVYGGRLTIVILEVSTREGAY